MITLSLRTAPDTTLEVEGLTPDRLASLPARDIERLPAWLGARRACLGDFFDVRGERADRVRIEGDLARVDGLGAGTAGGELVIAGTAGRRVAAGMTGGRVHVLGDVGDDAGLAMAGGVLQVSGRAGDRLGAALPGASRGMTGGEIVVSGSVGAGAGSHVRRGLVVVGGDAGASAARAMIAGTLVVFGRTGPDPGRGSRRGSVVALGGIVVPPTYRYACTFEPPHVRLVLMYLRRQYGLAIDERLLSARFERYCGDAGEPGKGEILVRVP